MHSGHLSRTFQPHLFSTVAGAEVAASIPEDEKAATVDRLIQILTKRKPGSDQGGAA